jgi:hypothetical protein
MIGRGAATDIKAGGPTYLEVVGPARLSKEFGDWVEAANAREPNPFVFNYEYDAPGHPDQYYCRADHYSYARYGIPSVSLSRGLHRDYHQVTDEAQYIDYPDYARLTQMVLDCGRFRRERRSSSAARRAQAGGSARALPPVTHATRRAGDLRIGARSRARRSAARSRARAAGGGIRAEAAVWSDQSIDWESYDAVVIRSCWDYHLRVAEFFHLARSPRVRARSASGIRPRSCGGTRTSVICSIWRGAACRRFRR